MRRRKAPFTGPSPVALVLGGVLAISILAPPIAASDFTIRPVRVEMSSASDVGVVTLRNNGDAPIAVQTRQVLWRQVEGVDTLDTTRDLLISPPFFELRPGGEQVVRIGLRSARSSTRASTHLEQAYRVFFTEIPRQTARGNGLSIALSLAIPVFIAPERAIDAPLEWWARPVDDALLVSIRNPANSHRQLKKLTFVDAEERTVFEHDGLGYLLAGEERSWRFDFDLQSVDIKSIDALGPQVPGSLRAILLTQHGTSPSVRSSAPPGGPPGPPPGEDSASASARVEAGI